MTIRCLAPPFGFVCVENRSEESATVVITAIGDTGERFGLASLARVLVVHGQPYGTTWLRAVGISLALRGFLVSDARGPRSSAPSRRPSSTG